MCFGTHTCRASPRSLRGVIPSDVSVRSAEPPTRDASARRTVCPRPRRLLLRHTRCAAKSSDDPDRSEDRSEVRRGAVEHDRAG